MPGLLPWSKKEDERDLAELPRQFRPVKLQAAHRAMSYINNLLLLQVPEFVFIAQQLLTDTKKDKQKGLVLYYLS